MKRTILILVVLATMIFCGACQKGNAGNGSKPNLLVISCSSLRPDHLEPYGYVLLKTPEMMALAEEGTLFEEAYVPTPVVLPSQLSIMTGSYPSVHGVYSNTETFRGSEDNTLAGILAKKGYTTAAFVSASILGTHSGIARGFAHFDDSFIKGLPLLYEPYGERIAAYTTNKAVKWLKENNKPFFAWIHYFDSHAEYFPPMDLQPLGRDPYDGEIAFIDQEMGRIIKTLKDKGLYDNTIIIFTSDSGDPLDQHGEPFQGLFLYNSSLHVPLIIKQASGETMKTDKISTPVSTLDIFPTIMDLLNIDISDTDGVSLVPAMNNSTLPDRTFYFETAYPLSGFGWKAVHGILKDNWKYFDTNPEMLFNLEKDKLENINIASSEKSRLELMKNELAQQVKKMSSGQTDVVDLSEYFSTVIDDENKYKREKNTDFTVDQMSSIANRLRSARRKFVANDTDAALKLLDGIVEEDPDNITALYYLSIIYYTRGDSEKSLNTLEHILTLDRQNFISWSNLGAYYLKRGKYAKSIAAYSAALKLKPESAIAHYNLGNVYLHNHDYGNAGEFLEKALELNDRDSNVLFGLAVVAEKKGDKIKALSLYKKAKDYWTGGKSFLGKVNARIHQMNNASGNNKNNIEQE